jgi:hypothetical protein
MSTVTNTTEFITLSQLIDDKTKKLYDTLGAFYAFGNKQFEEKRKPGINYVNLQSGLICPKENAKELLDTFDKIFDDAVRKQVQLFGSVRIIHHEYFNHETQLTRDIDKLIDVLEFYTDLYPDLFTEEIIRNESKACFKLAVDNDWF